MSNDNRRKLYDALSKDYDMGTYEQFCKDIQDDAKRKKLYDATSDAYDYGDYAKFSSQLGFGDSNAAPAPTAATPVEAVKPEQKGFTAQSKQEAWTPTPMQKAFMIGSAQSSLNSFKAKTDALLEGVRNTSDYYSRGGAINRSLPVKGDLRYNAEAGKMEQTYLTPTGTATADKVAAERETRAYNDYVDNMTVAGQLRRAGRDLTDLHRKREARVKAIRDKWAEDQKKNTAPLAAVLGAQTYVPSIQSDPEYRALTAAIHQAEKRVQTIQHESDRQDGKDVGFWRGFGEVVGDIRTWDFGYSGLMDAMTMLDATSKPSPNRPAKTEAQKSAEQTMLEQTYEAQQAEAAYGKNDSFWNRAGVMTGEMLPFMLDFAIMGGSKSGTSLVTRNLDAVLLRSLHTAAPKVARNKAVQWTTKALGAMPEDLLYRAPLMTNTVQGMKTASDIIDRKLGDVVIREDGTYDFSNNKTWGSAVWQGEANAIIENYSEMFGSHLEGVLSLKTVGKLADTFGAKRLSGILTKASNSELAGIAGTMQKHLNHLGVSDYIGEVGEEYYGQLWRTMLNLDDAYKQNPDGSRTNFFLDGQFHGDIWGGMALSMGLMGAGKYSVSAAAYGSMKHRVNKTDTRAAEVFTPEVWDGWRERIDGTTNDKIGEVAEAIVADPTLTDEQRAAAMNYMEASLNLRGFNLASVARQRGGEMSEDEAAANESYMDGYSASTPQEMRDVKKMLDLQRQRLASALSEDLVQDFDNDPIGALSITHDPELRGIASDYVNAKMVYDGMIQRVRDDVDGRIAQSDAMIDSHINRETGMIQPATMKIDDRKVYIVNGSVSMYEDGTGVDAQNSSESIIIRDAETGKVEFADPTQVLSVDEAIDVETEKDEARKQIINEVAVAAANNIDGVLSFNPGDTYSILDLEGNQQSVSVLGQIADENGMPIDGYVDIQFPDGSIESVATSDLQQWVDDANTQRVEQFDNEHQAQRAAADEAAQPDTEINPDENGVIDIPSPDSAEVDAMLATEQPEPSALSQIPTDQNGEPIYEQAEPDYAWDALVEQTEGDEDIAMSVIEQTISEKEDELKKLSKQMPKAGLSTSQKIQAEKDKKKAMDAIQQSIDHWKRMAGTKQRRQAEEDAIRSAEIRKRAEEARVKAKQERAEREEAERIEREALNGVPDWSRDTPQGETGESRSDGDAESGEREPDSAEPADSRAGTPSDSRDGDNVTPLQEVISHIDNSQPATIGEQIAKAEAEVNTAPTDKQKEAGNYKKGHVQVGTFDVSIENPKGSTRSGIDADGKKWETTMTHTYGYIRGTKGVDGDHIDVYISSDVDGWNGRNAYVVDQYNPDGSFDEHKVMLGFNDKDEAFEAYLSNYEKGWKNGRRLDVTAVNLEDFEKWIESSKRKTKPFADYKSVMPIHYDNMGNPIDAHGNLIIEDVESLNDISGSDFVSPTRTIRLPHVPQNVSDAIETNGRSIIIKKNIFVKNRDTHPELSPMDSRDILHRALYNPNLVGTTQPIRRPDYKVAIQTGDKNAVVVLDVYASKHNVEIVGWRKVDGKGLEKMKRQAEREGGQFLILSPGEGSAAALSALPSDVSSEGKDNTFSVDNQISEDANRLSVEESSDKQADKGQSSKGYTIESKPYTNEQGKTEPFADYKSVMPIRYDNQGNPIDHLGKLIVEDVNSIDEITDDDFVKPTRTISLPQLPDVVSEAIGSNEKRVIIKKNIFDKNHKSHRDLTPKDSREILQTALYTPSLYGQNQKQTRPYNWILIHLADKNTCVLLEVDNSKECCEIVNWHYLGGEQLKQKERQAEREGGRILTLSEDNVVGNTSHGLSSEGKDNTFSVDNQISEDANRLSVEESSDKQADKGQSSKGYTIESKPYTNKQGKTKPFADYKSIKSKEDSSMVGRSLSEQEATDLIAQMEANAEVARELPLTPQNWANEFGTEGIIKTPIGEVKQGDNQYLKLAQQGRNGKLGMIKPTLEHPSIIIEDERPANNGNQDRSTSYVFIKTFVKKDGTRYYHFASITVSKEGKEVVISSQERSVNRISKLLQQGKVTWIDEKFSLHPTTQIEESIPLNDSNRLTSIDSQPAMLGINSSELSSFKGELMQSHSEGKDNTLSSYKQTDDEQSSDGYTIEPRKDTRDNSDIFAVKFDERVSRDVFNGQKAIAKKLGGYWSNFGKKGFLFKTREEAEAFANEVLGKDMTQLSEEAPLSIDDMQLAIKPTSEETTAEKKAINPSGNKLVTDEQYAELLAKMRKKMGGQLNMGVDPEVLAIGSMMAVYHIEKGARKFAEYVKAMVADLGEKFPARYLKGFYKAAHEMIEDAAPEIAVEMDSDDFVNTADVASIISGRIDAMATAEMVVEEETADQEREEAERKLKEERNGKEFEYYDELAEAKERLEEYTEKMKAELAEKEAKYADMDADVEVASDITLSEEESEETDEEQRELYRISDEIEELFNQAISGEFKGKAISIGRLTDEGKAYLEQISGVIFKDKVDFVLNPSDLRHIYKRHFGENEKDGRNIPLDIEDIRSIIDIISNPDIITYSVEDGQQGRKMFSFLKKAEQGTYNMLEVYSDKKGNLTTKSFYKSKKAVSQRVLSLMKSEHLTSVTDGASLSDGAKLPKFFELSTDGDVESLERDGNDTYSDAEISMENDPWSKAWGESIRTKRRQEQFAERERNRMRERAKSLSSVLGIDIEIIEDASGLKGKKQRAKGWYDTKTGKITVVVSNHNSASDMEATILHEAVAHHGLRQLFGEHFDEFLDKVYEAAENGIKEKIDLLATRNGWNRRVATEEYLAGLAERTDFDRAEERIGGWFDKIKRFFFDMLFKAGFKHITPNSIGDNELRYILWRSYQNLANPGRYRAFEWEAEDVAMQYDLKVGDYAPHTVSVTEQSVAEAGEVYELNEQFNRELQQQIDGTLPEGHVYQLGNPGDVLLSIGVPNLPIQLSAQRLKVKATEYGHNFDLSQIRNLVKELQHPMAVFVYGNKGKMQNIIVGIESNGNQFIVGLSLNPIIQGKALEINSVRNVFPKKNAEWLNWISQGKLLYADKQKIQALIDKQRTILADVEYLDLEDVAKVVENFENPTIKEQNNNAERDNDVRFRDGDFTPSDRKLAADQYERMLSRGSWQFREATQDSMLGLKTLYESILGDDLRIENVAGYENAYLYENRMSSANNGEQHQYFSRFMKPLLESIHKLCGSKELDRRILTDYMIAKHGLERNEYMRNEAAANGEDTDRDFAGLCGLTGEDDWQVAETVARQMVDDYEADHDTAELWDNVKKATNATLEKIYISGLISEDSYNNVLGMYDFYIPLRGWDETTSDEVYGYLTSTDGPLMGSVFKTAEGRESKADDPIATIAIMADDAIRQGNRNIMKQRFLNFVHGNPSDLVSVNEMWLQHNDVTDEWEPVFADLQPDMTHAEVESEIAKFEAKMEGLAAAEPDKYKKGRDAGNIPYKVVSDKLKEHQVLVKRNGRTYVMTINGNPRAAQALNGLTNPDVETGGVIGNMLKLGEYVNRHLSAFYTTRNPDFVVSNFMRDMLYSNCMMWVKENPRYALRFHKNFGKVNPLTLRRLLSKWENDNLSDSNYLEKMFKEFMLNGGETGYTLVKDIKGHKRTIASELKKQGSTGRKAWSALGMQLDLLNRSAENCARFAAFLTSREMGRTLDRSIYDAKDVSVNFNKKGSGGKFVNATGQKSLGKIGSYLGGGGRIAFVFWNAGIQGMTNFGRAGKRNPGKAIGGAAALFTLGYVIPLLSQMLGGGDGDDDDKNAYYNLPEYVRRSNICFKAEEQWITIPLPIEYRAIYGMGELACGVISGNERYSNFELTRQMASQVSQIMPLDMLEGGGGISPFIPSALKPLTEAYILNKGWTGLPVYKEDTPYNKKDPEWTKAYQSADQHLVEFTRWLNETSGGNDYKKGTIDINPAKLEYLLTGTFGGAVSTIEKLKKMGETAFGEREFEWRNMLLANRIIKSGDERTANRKLQNEYFKYLNEYEETNRLRKKYENAAKGGILGYAERADFLFNSPEYLRFEIFEKFKPDIDAIRKGINEETDSEKKKDLQNDLFAIMRDLVDKLHDVDDK